MTPALFTWALFFGASAIALWVVIRFPKLAPQSGRGVTIWLLGACAAMVGAPTGIMAVGGLAGRICAAMFVALPCGICIMLAVAWIMLWVIRSILPHVR